MKTYKRKPQEHQEIEDAQELCRLCLDKTEEGIPIFKDDQDVCAAVAMRIMICVGLEMKFEDSLPNMICMNCYEELENYYRFRRKCEVSYHKLKSHALAIKYKENKDIQMELPVEYSKPVVESPEESNNEVMAEDKELALGQMTEQLSEVNENATEKVIEMEEVQIPIQTEANPDIGTFLTTILTELGILGRHEDGFVIQDQAIMGFELETGDEEQLMLELIEEDEGTVELNQLDMEQSLQNDDLENKEEVFIGVKTKQTNRKGNSKLAGPWCVQCGRVFSSRSAAARHARAHGGARPHACAVCQRAFAQAAVRDRHMLVHLDVRPHACGVCGKSFTQRGALAAHTRAHAAPPARALALHRCALCDKVFLYASGLSRHMVSHAGRSYGCSACDKHFTDRSSLLRHLRNFYHDEGRAGGAGAADT